MVVDIKQHKSQFKNSNITITQCHFADCVMVKFEFLNCDLCCFISTTTMSPLHCRPIKNEQFFYINIIHTHTYIYNSREPRCLGLFVSACNANTIVAK